MTDFVSYKDAVNALYQIGYSKVLPDPLAHKSIKILECTEYETSVLCDNGIRTLQDLFSITVSKLATLPGVTALNAKHIIKCCQSFCAKRHLQTCYSPLFQQ